MEFAGQVNPPIQWEKESTREEGRNSFYFDKFVNKPVLCLRYGTNAIFNSSGNVIKRVQVKAATDVNHFVKESKLLACQLSKKQYIKRIKRYLVFLRNTLLDNKEDQRAFLLKSQATCLVEMIVKNFSNISLYVNTGGLMPKCMIVPCLWPANGESPYFYFWNDGLLSIDEEDSFENYLNKQKILLVAEKEKKKIVLFSRIQVLSYHHLLYGSEHKKEKAVVSAAKSLNIKGFILYGTPGIIVLCENDDVIVRSYLDECRSIGKSGNQSVSFFLKNQQEENICQELFTRGLDSIDLTRLREIMLYFGKDEIVVREILGLP